MLLDRNGFDFSDTSVAIIDDNRNFLNIVRTILRGEGVKKTFEAQNAYDALDLLRSEQVDCIMADYRMPEIDGLELVHMIRADRRLASRRSPIICISGHSERSVVEAAIRAGVDDFLVKPISAQIIMMRLTRHLAHPLDYFETDSYFGPDRRRILSGRHQGNERRRPTIEV